MEKCKSCFSRIEGSDVTCPVCGIDKHKEKNDFTQEERKKRFSARAIRGVSIFNLVAAIGMVVSIFVMRRYVSPDLRNEFFYYSTFLLIQAVLCIVLFYGLWNYKKWSYYLAVGFYGLIWVSTVIMAFVEKEPIIPVIILLPIVLYFLANQSSRSLFNHYNMSLSVSTSSS